MRDFSYAAPAPFTGRTVHAVMFDSLTDLADACRHGSRAWKDQPFSSSFFGDHTVEQATGALRDGDLARAAKSDALLARMEDFEIPTARRAWRDDVCGSLPNVPAYIAGHPLAMRRRVRDDSASAPLAIIADLTTSAIITPEQIAKRGAAILALVRALASRRPIELWVCSGVNPDNRKDAVFICARIDTTPLDLARAAYALTHAAMPRRLMYGVAKALHGYSGGWPFGRGGLDRAGMEACLAPAFSHVTETLCLPGLRATDDSVNNPQAWLARQIAEHGAVNLDEAA